MTETSSSKDPRTVKEIMDKAAPVHSRTPAGLNDVGTLVALLALLAAIVFVFTR
jgi:hypothetical protein